MNGFPEGQSRFKRRQEPAARAELKFRSFWNFKSLLLAGLAVISFIRGNAGVTLFDPCVSSNMRGARPKAFGSLRKLFSKRFLFPFFSFARSKFLDERGLLCR